MIHVSISGSSDMSEPPPAASQPHCLLKQLHHWKPPLCLAVLPRSDARRWSANAAHLAAIGTIRSHLAVHFVWKADVLSLQC